jgi:hypothetical protein
MGYYSEVLLAVAFETKEQLEEVWAVYCLNPKVQEHDLAKHWKKKLDGAYPVLWYHLDSGKWYDSYEDVQAFEALFTLAETFGEEREFGYAWINFRIGEEDDDTERKANDNCDPIRDDLYDYATIRRSIDHAFN